MQGELPALLDLPEAKLLIDYEVKFNHYSDDPARGYKEAYEQEFVPLQRLYRNLKHELLG